MPVLTNSQIAVLRSALHGRLSVLSYGAGLDSAAMAVALHAAGLRPDLLLFADTGGERPPAYRHIEDMQAVLGRWGWDPIVTCRHRPGPRCGYNDLYENCMVNATLPSLAFGFKACSLKWKGGAMDRYLAGASRGPNRRDPHPLMLRAQAQGTRIVRLIGYDDSAPDQRRSARLAAPADDRFDYLYPLQLIGWDRLDCLNAVSDDLGSDMVPEKSSCFYCPALREWERYWMAASEPELLEQALRMEWNAMTGRHSRFGAPGEWERLVRSGLPLPTDRGIVGLGRNTSWNHWAVCNGVVDASLAVLRGAAARARFFGRAHELRGIDNALDRRSLAQPATVRLFPGLSAGRAPAPAPSPVNLFAGL